ncbi:MAG: biotin--[acetyl-CoA-carboxylase] ligase [Thermoplasmatota archaeon]
MAWDIHRLDTCASTMDEARQRAAAGAEHGTVVVAPTMTDGRGQHDRAWHAPEGGLYLSMVLRGLDNPRLLTLALGNAVADVLEVAGAQPALKWVNDVLVDDRKVAGILAEAESTGDQVDFIVAGIGVNVNGKAADFPDDLKGTAATLEDILGAESCIEDLESYLLDEITRQLRLLEDGRGDEVVAAWRRRDALAGQAVDVDGVAGEAAGIDDAGHLLVRTPDGEQTVAAGTVRLVA